MKNIKLKRLELTNYRNIDHAVYEFNGNSKIVGDNRIGKTNTLESIYWLLTGYLLNGSSDIAQIKPQKDTRATVIVKGTFDIDGKEINICKKYGEEWAKQRGTDVEQLKGHFCELYYNDVKQTSNRDYELLFKEDFGLTCNVVSKLSIVQLLVNPYYIGDLCENGEWKEVRQLIISLVGDITDEDVFNAEPSTRILYQELALTNGRIDQVKQHLLGNIKSLKEALIADDAKIEMLAKTERPSEEAVESARKFVDSINNQPNGNSALNDLKNTEIRLSADKTNFLFALGRLEKEFNEKCKQLESADLEKDLLLGDYRELKAKEIVVDKVCPVCKRPLTAEQLAEARKNAELKKQTDLDLIIVEGKKKAVLIEELEKDVKEKQTQIDNTKNMLAETETKLAEVQKQIDELDKPTENAVDPAELEKAKSILADLEYYERQQKELHNCKIEQKEHNKQLIANEQMREAVDKFMFVKLNLLNNNVSKVFGGIKFQLIKENLNGGFDTVCKPYIYDPITKTSTGILWKSGSKSERVATGIAIAECIKTKLGLSNLPYLFDEGGEISGETMKTRLITESQIICVKVEDGVKTPSVVAI